MINSVKNIAEIHYKAPDICIRLQYYYYYYYKWKD